MADPAHERRFSTFQPDMGYGERTEFIATTRELKALLKHIERGP